MPWKSKDRSSFLSSISYPVAIQHCKHGLKSRDQCWYQQLVFSIYISQIGNIGLISSNIIGSTSYHVPKNQGSKYRISGSHRMGVFHIGYRISGEISGIRAHIGHIKLDPLYNVNKNKKIYFFENALIKVLSYTHLPVIVNSHHTCSFSKFTLKSTLSSSNPRRPNHVIRCLCTWLQSSTNNTRKYSIIYMLKILKLLNINIVRW